MAFELFKKSKPVRQAQDKPVSKRKLAAKKVVAEETSALSAQAGETVVAPASVTISKNSVILHPYVSEKATRLEGVNQYMFKVTRTANKPEVKKAIQSRYNVSVIAVNMVNMPSKKRTVGHYVGTKSGFRKAIVTLAKGDTINSAKA